MFDSKKKIHDLRIGWLAEIRDEEGALQQQYRKSETESLSDFIVQASQNQAQVFADFIIDGQSLGLWWNMNIARRKDVYYDLMPNMSADLDFRRKPLIYPLSDYMHLHLRQLQGEIIRYEDAEKSAIFWERLQRQRSNKPALSQDELAQVAKPSADWIYSEEIKDVALFVSGCCGDRYCGYMPIHVFAEKNTMTWQFRFLPVKIIFDKQQYLSALAEYADFLQQKDLTENFAS
jgi:hypothetical protein